MGSSRDAVRSVTLSIVIMSEIRKGTKRDDEVETRGKGRWKFSSSIIGTMRTLGSRAEMLVDVVYMNSHHEPMPPVRMRLINCLSRLSRDVLQLKQRIPSARANQGSSIEQMLGCQAPDSRDAAVFACGSETRLARTGRGTFPGSCTSLVAVAVQY